MLIVFRLHCRFDSAISWSAAHNLVDPTGLNITLTRCIEGHHDGIPSIEVETVLRNLTVRPFFLSNFVYVRERLIPGLCFLFFFMKDVSR